MRLGIDIGGTFTDLVAVLPDGTVRSHKVATTPGDYAQAILDGLEALLIGEPVDAVLHATTIGSNTVLEGTGARTALLTTAGFRDVLEIRDLRMPRLYYLHWTKPAPLVERRLRIEIVEKTRFDGSIAVPLDIGSVVTAIRRLREAQVESVAICLMHSYVNPAHEQVLAGAVRAALPGVTVTASHELLPEIREYPRTSTTVVNAYLQPVMQGYLDGLSGRLRQSGVDAPLALMQSNGGLAAADYAAEFPARIIESGPAAGVVGAAVLAARLREPAAISFDMGGTTAKAALIADGQVMRAEALEVGGGVMAGSRGSAGAGYLVRLPTIDLAEVGAGGGSVCRLDAAGAPKAGPRSAGAIPGPVAYGRGGTEPTITDCALVLGFLDPAGLAGGTMPLDLEAARGAVMATLARPLDISLERAADGMLRIASATMTGAIRSISVERGRDCRDHTLIAFGGNGPLFAAMLAAELGIKRILVPPMPGLFSAFGLLLADTEHHVTRSVRMRLDAPDVDAFALALDQLIASGDERLAADGFPPDRRSARVHAMARYTGQSSELAVPLPPGEPEAMLAALPAAFAAEHARVHGYRAPPGEPVELTALGVVARGRSATPRLPERMPPARVLVPPSRQAWFAATGWVEVPVCDRASLAERGVVSGPIIVQEYDATCLVPPDAKAEVDPFGNIRVTLA